MKALNALAWALCLVWTGPVLAQADVPEEGAAPTGMDPRVTFAQEAWKVRQQPFMEALSLPPGFGTQVDAVDNQGEPVDISVLTQATSNEKVKDGLNSTMRKGAVKWTLVGLSVTGVIVPVVMSLPGAALGGLLGALLLQRTGGSTTSDLPSKLTPYLLGGTAGALLGLGGGAVVGLMGMVLVGQVLSLFIKPLDASPVITVVSEHNRALAKSLQLDPETLPAEYFPVPL